MSFLELSVAPQPRSTLALSSGQEARVREPQELCEEGSPPLPAALGTQPPASPPAFPYRAMGVSISAGFIFLINKAVHVHYSSFGVCEMIQRKVSLCPSPRCAVGFSRQVLSSAELTLHILLSDVFCKLLILVP